MEMTIDKAKKMKAEDVISDIIGDAVRGPAYMFSYHVGMRMIMDELKGESQYAKDVIAYGFETIWYYTVKWDLINVLVWEGKAYHPDNTQNKWPLGLIEAEAHGDWIKRVIMNERHLTNGMDITLPKSYLATFSVNSIPITEEVFENGLTDKYLKKMTKIDILNETVNGQLLKVNGSHVKIEHI